MRFSPARLTVLLCAIACLALPSTSYALDAGDVAPPVHGVSVLGGRPLPFDLRAALRHHAVVLYFFPKAFSQG